MYFPASIQGYTQKVPFFFLFNIPYYFYYTKVDIMAEPHVRNKNKVIVSVAVVVVIVAASLYVFYDFNGRSFDISDRQALLIVTDSMDGDVTDQEINSFPSNTFVMVKHLSDSEKQALVEGDVISFRYSGVLDHHRIIETNFEENYVITHGDNTHSTEKVYLSEINGKVVGTNVWLGHTVAFVKDNFLIVIALIAAFAIAGEVYRAYKDGVFSKEE